MNNYIKKFMKKNSIKFYDEIYFPKTSLPNLYITPDYTVMTYRSNGDRTQSYWIEENLGYTVLVKAMMGKFKFKVKLSNIGGV